jgi:hypothetical protein
VVEEDAQTVGARPAARLPQSGPDPRQRGLDGLHPGRPERQAILHGDPNPIQTVSRHTEGVTVDVDDPIAPLAAEGAAFEPRRRDLERITGRVRTVYAS